MTRTAPGARLLAGVLALTLLGCSGASPGRGEAAGAAARLEIRPPRAAVAVGEVVRLDAVGPDAPEGLAWRSSQPAVASVAGGVVTARRVGVARIEASGPAGTATATITVVPPRPVVSIDVSPGILTLAPGVTRAVRAAVRGPGGTLLPDRRVRWASSRNRVASVSEDGVVTGRAPGIAVIRAEADGTTGAAKVVVTRRAAEDRVDDQEGSQVHLVYAVPADGGDRRLDLDGTIASSVARFQRWLSVQTGGYALRLDTYRGSLDVSFVRLPLSDGRMKAHGTSLRWRIEEDLKRAGFDDPDKLYAVYYDGGSAHACGGGAWPPAVAGRVAVEYLLGTPPGAPACASTGFPRSSDDPPGYVDFGMLHEIIHTMGFVDASAPHHTHDGHVSDSPADLMYGGSEPWRPSALDVGGDDYFGRSVPAGVRTLTESPFITPV